MPGLVPFSTLKTGTRYAGGAYVNGTYAAGATSTFTARISVQGEKRSGSIDMFKPREGGRWLDGFVILYSDTELQPGTDTAIGDRLTHEGVLYEVTGCNLWDHIPRISHYECFAQRVANNT